MISTSLDCTYIVNFVSSKAIWLVKRFMKFRLSKFKIGSMDPVSKIGNSHKYSNSNSKKFCHPIMVKKSQKKANKMISYLNFQANRSKSSAIIRILAIQKQVRTCLLTLTLSTEQLFARVFSRVFSNSLFSAVFENN